MPKNSKKFGEHYLVEFIDCNAQKLKRVKDVKTVLLQAAVKSRSTIIKSIFHQFSPAGVSGAILIAESHFTIHTWPEHQYASFDLQTCGDMKPLVAIHILKKRLQAKKVVIRVVPRGNGT